MRRILIINSNTTLVKVKLDGGAKFAGRKYRFKYNSC